MNCELYFQKKIFLKTVWENVFCVELSVPYKAFDMQIRRHANDSLEEKERTNYKTPVKFIDNIDPQRKWRENEAGKKTWAWARNDAAPLRGRNTVLSVNCFSVFEATGKILRSTKNPHNWQWFSCFNKKRTRRQWVRVYTPMMTLFLAAQKANILFRVASATICFFFFIWDDDHVTWLSWNLSGYLSSYLAK